MEREKGATRDIRKIINIIKDRNRKIPQSNFLKQYANLNIVKAISGSSILPQHFSHKVLNGRAKEIFIKDLLKPFLPNNIDICSGVIFDSKGYQSDQIDIIIYNKNVISPVLLTMDEGAIPYEAVLCTIEIKSKLTKTELIRSIKNAWSIKTLHFHNENFFPLSGLLGQIKEQPKVHSPLCALFAFGSDISIKHYANELERLIDTVNKFNEISNENHMGKNVFTPLGLFCIAKSVTYLCKDADNPQEKRNWSYLLHDETNNNLIYFLSEIIDICNALSLERNAIKLGAYIEGYPFPLPSEYKK